MDGKIINLSDRKEPAGDPIVAGIVDKLYGDEDDPFGLDEEWRTNERRIIDKITDGLEQLIIAENGEEFFRALRGIREEADRWV